MEQPWGPGPKIVKPLNIFCKKEPMLNRLYTSRNPVLSTASQWQNFYQSTSRKNVNDLPMESVMTFNLSRTSLTTILFCRGVARQHKTDRQCFVSSKNFASKPPWKITLNVLPSITSPTSGLAISVSGAVWDLCLLKRLLFFFSGEIFLISSKVQSIIDSQVSYNAKKKQISSFYSFLQKKYYTIKVDLNLKTCKGIGNI